ncbi:UNVERIFIED_CONTAM: hypothetical protein Sradi_5276600 [Sesamum radiatum]|uniref:Integrase zinc-binding domain-containing protein n=1 Tax=Sesamum radiatum TaxID=300843 RepID=A0AAW2LPQ2_SESRA
MKNTFQTIDGKQPSSKLEPFNSSYKEDSSIRNPIHPLLWCLCQQEGVHVLKEIHNRFCGAHAETWILANKALRAGYFWPTVEQDGKQLVNKCEKCQKYSSLILILVVLDLERFRPLTVDFMTAI